MGKLSTVFWNLFARDSFARNSFGRDSFGRDSFARDSFARDSFVNFDNVYNHKKCNRKSFNSYPVVVIFTIRSFENS